MSLPPAPIRILCVDDSVLVAEAVEIKLRLAGGFQWLGRLPDANDLLQEARRLRPHVVLLDVDMPGKDPFVALQELREADPEIRTLMLSGHIRTDLIDRAVEAGAWGYVSKNEGTDSIVTAIRRVAAGEFTIGPDIESVYRLL